MLIDLKTAAEILRTRDDFCILPHINPDGDALGSGYALCSALQKLGKRAKVSCADAIPTKFDYMKKAIVEEKFTPANFIAVDVADTKLLGANSIYADDIVLCIDHHVSNLQFAQNTLLDVKAAATAEMIFHVIKELGVQLDSNMAACIYTGIATDTGCFKYSNTTANTHMVASELLKYDFNHSKINYNMFDLKSKGTILLEKQVMESLSFYYGGKLALVAVTTEMMEKAKIDGNEDFGGISSIPRQIEGVEVGVTLRQKGEDHFKTSIRTNAQINASEICKSFGGGGHPRAAGCEFHDSLDNIITAIVKRVSEEFHTHGLV